MTVFIKERAKGFQSKTPKAVIPELTDEIFGKLRKQLSHHKVKVTRGHIYYVVSEPSGVLDSVYEIDLPEGKQLTSSDNLIPVIFVTTGANCFGNNCFRKTHRIILFNDDPTDKGILCSSAPALDVEEFVDPQGSTAYDICRISSVVYYAYCRSRIEYVNKTMGKPFDYEEFEQTYVEGCIKEEDWDPSLLTDLTTYADILPLYLDGLPLVKGIQFRDVELN
jgi:hypothetical protein